MASKYTPYEEFTDEYDLPIEYGDTSFTLIARDPNWIYAYWEIASGSIDAYRGQYGEALDRAALVLRMYDVTCIDFNGSNANHSFDIEVGRHSNNHYINLWSDNASYCADLGLKLPSGEFLSLARSNAVTTPRKSQSGRYDEIWLDTKDGASPDPFVVQDAVNARRRNGESAKKRSGHPEPVASDPVKEENRKKRFYITEDDVREYYMRISPLLWDIISTRIAKHARKGTDILRSLERRPTLDEILQQGLGKGKFVKRLLSNGSEQNAEWGENSGGASESIFSGSSESHHLERRRQFFFELGTELIVYGRTEPDATVYHGDKVVSLRPDGTFTLHFSLPDAARIPLDFRAVSNDKVETREIVTAAERQKTEYKIKVD